MRGEPGLSGIVSVHDVMPRTLPRVRGLLEWLGGLGVSPVTLLVVPGVEWSGTDLEELRSWESNGCELAGHGWLHETTPRALYHRLHAALISRDVAEHLALDAEGVESLVKRCYAWFGEHGFRTPSLYVPPAWAMGAISRERVRTLPFARYEYLRGVLDAVSGSIDNVPMVGFEADTRWRRWAVRRWNWSRLGAARRGKGRLRIGIHPRDLELPLAGDLEKILRSCSRFSGYGGV